MAAFRVSGHSNNLHVHTLHLIFVQHVTGAMIRSPADTSTRVHQHVRSVPCKDYLAIILKSASAQQFLAIFICGKFTQWPPTTKSSYKNGCAKNGRTCIQTVLSVGPTDARLETKPNPTAKIRGKKSKKNCLLQLPIFRNVKFT